MLIPPGRRGLYDKRTTGADDTGSVHLAVAAAIKATGGTDRAEAMLLLENLNSLLGEVDKVLAELDPRVD